MTNDSSGQKTLLGKRMLIVGVPILLLLLAVIVFALRQSKAPLPATIALSEAAAGIREGIVLQVEDSLSTGEFTLHYQDGKIQKGMRDPNTSLLQQLNLLGVSQEQLAKVEFRVLKSSAAASAPATTFLGFLIVGGVLFAAMRMSRTERPGKKNYEEVSVPKVRFNDVAGLDENLQELQDIVTFLKDRSKFTEIGARMPAGVLMVGEPGTGKTLIARAVAGEAGVPFFAVSGSEFTEVYVGVGASRIRSLFQKARKKAPCIIFIDEIDAVGRARHRSESGAEMEQDQTLNQLLVEMDGFGASEGIIVLAATNRVDVLDPALLRPGRFDRRVHVYPPDVKGRQAILQIHVKGKRLSEEVSLENVAKATPGLVGADLANVVNEAAIAAVRASREVICMHDFEEAIEKTLAGGVQRKNYMMQEDERRIIAYHEAGHAVVMHATPQSDPVYKVTIIPRGPMGGYTMSLPEGDRLLTTRCKMLARITGLLGGRAAEELFFQDITTGAANDLNVATQLAEEMVTKLGMDPGAGLRVFPQYQGRSLFSAPVGSQKTHEAIDEAVNNILDTCYEEARRILIEKKDTVDRLAGGLLEQETIDKIEFERLMTEPELVSA